MRTGWLALLLIAPLLSGCLSFLEPDEDPKRDVSPAGDVPNPDEIIITGVAIHNHPSDGGGQDRIAGFGGVELPYIVYEPLASRALADGGTPTFPVLIFVHGFGDSKERWLCTPMGAESAPALPDDPCPYENMLDRFARAGFIAVAYDVRGFGQATGQVTIVGPDEMADLDAVINFAQSNFPHNGKVGITGISYGGAHALLALGSNAKVTTAVAHQGWYDLYEALLPGNTPKAEWAAMLVGSGTVTSGGNMHQMVYNWATDATQRQNLGDIEDALDVRSPMGRLATVDKPLLVCAAMQDTLFTQADQIWSNAGGFTRAMVHAGGHGTFDPACWDKTEQWFQFFLRGLDTHVDEWPALETVDVSGDRSVAYTDFPATVEKTYYLREPSLTEYAPSNRTFTIEQRIANNPLQEPAAVWDQVGQPNQELPYSMREDPTAVFFEAAPFDDSQVLLGSASLDLVVAPTFENTAFQVTGQLISVKEDGSSRIMARGAYSHVPGVTEDHNATPTMHFSYTKADIQPGTMIVLKLSGNDLSWFLPFYNNNDPNSSNYAMQFTSHSQLHLPFYEV